MSHRRARLLPSLSWRGLAVAMLALLLTLLVSETLLREARDHLLGERQRSAVNMGAQLRAKLESSLIGSLHLATGLDAYLQATGGVLRSAEVEALLSGLHRQGSFIRNIGIAPGNRLEHVFPLAGNEAAIGLYYPDVPAQWPAVERAMRERKPNLAGPLALRQGGRGLIYRVPVFMADGSYWGLISTVIDADRFLDVNAVIGNGGERAALRTVTPDGTPGPVFWGSADTFSAEARVYEIVLPGAEWQLAVLPAGIDTTPLVWPRIGGWLLAVILAVLSYAYTRVWHTQRELSRRLLRISEQVPGVVYQLLRDADGHYRYLYASEGLREVFRIAPEAVRDDAAALFEALHPDDRAAVNQAYAESANTGLPVRQRFRVRFADGETRWLRGNAVAQRDDDGSCVWYGFTSDITDEVLVEEKLRLAASVFANTQEGVLITDAAGLIADVNPAFSRITGYTREEVLGRNPALLGSGHHDRDFFARMWQALLEGGHWRGEIWNRNKAGEVYPELLSISSVRDGQGQVSHFIGTFTDITQIKQREIELERIAHFDPLTGLPNRRLLGDRMRQGVAQSKRTGRIMAVALLDLDNFKPINDGFGHEAGDAVLEEIGRRLSGVLREGDTAARLGGDEFVLLLLGLEWIEECDTILQRVLAALSQPIIVGGRTHHVSASIGVTLFPQDNADPDLLLRHADQAMYAAKESGRNGYRFFDSEHDRMVRTHRRLLEELAVALERGQFMLHYQPRVDMAAGKVVGAEALLRWQHPERGLLAAEEFLYAVEGSALETPLGEWVIATALAQLRAFRDDGHAVQVSVNIEARQLLHPDFPARLASLLAQSGVDPQDFELEISQSSVPADIARAAENVRHCRRMNVHVALDHFGTSHASFAFFRQLPVDVLKVDQTMVGDLRDDAEDLALVRSIVRIAEVFHIRMVAEGVESIEQGALLIHLGCRLAQGFAIAPPMPAPALATWMHDWPGDPSWRGAAGLPHNLDDLGLVVAEAHLRAALVAMRKPDAAGAAVPASGPDCAFARWLTGEGRRRYHALTEFQHLERLYAEHVAAHTHAPSGATTGSTEDRARGDALIDAVGQLIGRVAFEQVSAIGPKA